MAPKVFFKQRFVCVRLYLPFRACVLVSTTILKENVLRTNPHSAERPCGASTALKRRAASEEFHPLRGGGGGEGARNGKRFGGLDHL